jgi:hypothetical protein
MTSIREKDLDRLHRGVLEIYPDSVWPTWRGGWPNRADLALLDAIYSTRQKYETAVLPKVIDWKSRYPAPPSPELEYLSTINEVEIQNIFGKNVLPGVRIPRVNSGKRKSAGVKEVAQLLSSSAVGLGSAQLICEAVERGDSALVLEQLQRTKGVGGATASYFLILLGIDGVKVDTLLGSWVRTRMGDQTMSGGAIRELVTRVATEKFNRDAKELDYAIWRYESVRRAGRKMGKKL